MAQGVKDNVQSTRPRALWVVSELYYPEETSTGFVVTKIAEGLASEFDVQALCGQPTYSARGVRAPRYERHKGVRIRRCSATTLNKDVLPFKVINLLTVSLSMFFHALWRIRRGHMVLVVTNPPLLPFLIALCCRLRGGKMLLLVHDVYPDVMIAAGIVKPGSTVSRLGGWVNRLLYRSAKRIIVIGRDMQLLLSRRLGENNGQRLAIITNWADVDQIHPESRADNPLLAEAHLQGKFVVGYAGNMGYPNDLQGLLDAALRLRPDSRIHFLLLGAGAKRSWVEKTVKANDLENVTLLSGRPRSEQQVFLNACDIALVSLVRGMTGVSVPSRMYNIMAAGKPIIAVAEEGSELACVINEEEVGWLVPPHAPDRLSEIIQEALASPDKLKAMGQRARAVAEGKYSFSRVLAQYRDLLNSVSH